MVFACKYILIFTHGISFEEREKRARSGCIYLTIWCEGWEGRGTAAVATTPFVTHSTQRESGTGGRSSRALARSGLPPHLPTQQPVRRCRRAAEGKIERCSWSAGCLKRYSCFHESQGFPGEGGYAAPWADSLWLLRTREHPFAWKGLLFPGQGPQPLSPAMTIQLKHYKISHKGETEMVAPFRHVSVVNWTKNGFSVRKIQKAIEERKITNQIFISTKTQTWKSWAECLTLLVSYFMYSGQRETRQHGVPAPALRAPIFRGVLCLQSHPPTYIGNWMHFSLKSCALTNKIKEIKFEVNSLRL